MTRNLKSRRIKRLVLPAILCLVLLAFIPLPFKLTIKDKEGAVSHALTQLYSDRRVLTDNGYSHLYDAGFVKDKSRVYFQNDLGIRDEVFLENGLKPVPRGRRLNVDNGDVIVSFSGVNVENRPISGIHFSYVFGSMGAQGYEIRIYKSLLIRYYVFIHRWVS